jgi:hypothetical protein
VERQEFLTAWWRKTVVDQSPADLVEHFGRSSDAKLDRRCLHEVTDALWEICDGRFEWQAWRNEAVILRTMTKERVLRGLIRGFSLPLWHTSDTR